MSGTENDRPQWDEPPPYSSNAERTNGAENPNGGANTNDHADSWTIPTDRTMGADSLFDMGERMKSAPVSEEGPRSEFDSTDRPASETGQSVKSAIHVGMAVLSGVVVLVGAAVIMGVIVLMGGVLLGIALLLMILVNVLGNPGIFRRIGRWFSEKFRR
ncbi:MAG: hypothetical protein PHE53_11685 [Thermoguttaceae bacterium]|nr:hypothetical protein [Thermoguttaceae bacterium]